MHSRRMSQGAIDGRFLKLLTTLLVLVMLGLMVAYPALLKAKPNRGADKAQVLAYSRLSALYIGSLLVCVTGAGIGSVLILRQAREEFREQSRANMRALIESVQESEKARRRAEDGQDAPPA